MRICFVSTYPPIECGIATYCSYLVEALRTKSNEIYIVSQYGGSGEGVFPAFGMTDADPADKIFKMIVKFTPDIVHVQHEFNIYGPRFGVNIIPLFYRLRLDGFPTVVTIHTVHKEINEDHKIVLEPIIKGSDIAIVHEDYQRDVINAAFDNPGEIHVIPHGVRDVQPIRDAKDILGLSGKKVILLCGYFRPNKGFIRIVKIFPEIAKRIPEAVLVVAGKMRLIEHEEYRKELFHEIANSPVKDRINVFRGQFPTKTFDTILSAADVVPFAYTIGDQSGMLAQVLAFNKPFVISDLPSFRKISEKTGGGSVACSDGDYVNLICSVLKDDEYASFLSNNIKNYVEKNLYWDIIADRHMDIYNSVAKFPYSNAKYIYIK